MVQRIFSMGVLDTVLADLLIMGPGVSSVQTYTSISIGSPPEERPHQMKEIRFFGKRYASYRFLSNFYGCTLLMGGKVYASVEHYYQAKKTLDETEHEMVRLAASPGEAKRLGGKPEDGGKITIRPDWEDMKEVVMKEALREKFSDSALREKLLDTGDAILIESSPSDYYWGEGATHTGKNRLGVLLMEVRQEIRDRNQR